MFPKSFKSVFIFSYLLVVSHLSHATHEDFKRRCDTELVAAQVPFLEPTTIHASVPKYNEVLTVDFKDTKLQIRLGSMIIQKDLGIKVRFEGESQEFIARGGSAVSHVFELSDLRLTLSRGVSSSEVTYLYEGKSGPNTYRVELTLERKTLTGFKIWKHEATFFSNYWDIRREVKHVEIGESVSLELPELFLSPQTSRLLFLSMWNEPMDVPAHEFSPYFTYRKKLHIGKEQSYLVKGLAPAELVDIINGLIGINIDGEDGVSLKAAKALYDEVVGTEHYSKLLQQSLSSTEE